MGLFNFFGNKNNNQNQAMSYRYQYTMEQDSLISQFISQNYGQVDSYIQDICGNTIKVDLLLLSPNENYPYYLLITKGLGAYLMAMSDYNNPEDNFSRIELVLKSDEPWEISCGDNKDYWAQELCSAIVDNIVNQGLNLSSGSLSQKDIGLDNNDCPAQMFINPTDDDDSLDLFKEVYLNNNDKVSFLFLSYDYDTECDMSNSSFDCVDDLLQSAALENIDPINAYNRAAFFVRWALDNNLINENYHQDLNGDIRTYLKNQLNSLDKVDFFTQEGLEFVEAYYDIEDQDCANYLDDLYNYLIELKNDLLDDNSYCLHLEYNDSTYNDIKELLDDVYDAFLGQVEYDNSEDYELYKVAKGILNTDCIYFAPTNDDYHLTSMFSYSHEPYRFDQDENTECPIIVELDYNYVVGLINYLCPNSARANSFDYDPNELKYSVEQALNESQSYLGQAPEILSRLMQSNLEDLQNNGGTLEDLQGDISSALIDLENDQEQEPLGPYDFGTYWRSKSVINPNTNEQEEITSATLLTYIPVKRPYQTLAFLPFVPSNCGMNLGEIMAIAEYFEQRYEAYVSVVSVDTIEFTVDRALSQEDAQAAASDLYAFTPYALDMCGIQDATLAHLAAYLMNNSVWTCAFECPDDNDNGYEQEQDDSSFTF